MLDELKTGSRTCPLPSPKRFDTLVPPALKMLTMVYLLLVQLVVLHPTEKSDPAPGMVTL